MVTLKNVITRLDPDSLPAQALEGEQSQLISVVKSLFPYCNAISNILFRTRMITASLDKARIEYATDDDSSRTRAAPPTKKKKMKNRKKTTTASTINKIDTQRNSKANRRLSNAITTTHNKEYHDKTKNKGIKRLSSRPSNRSRSAGGKRKSSQSSNTSSKIPLMSYPNVALQFQKVVMQKMIQQKRLRQDSTSALFNIFSSIIQQGAMSEKIVNLEHQYIADPPRIFKALGYAMAIATTISSSAATAAATTTIKTIQSTSTEKIPIALAPASDFINLHSIARRTIILPFLKIQQPSREDTTRADENETIFEDTTISKEQQQQYVQPIRSTSSVTAKKPAASSTGAELLPPIFLHKALFRNVITSIEKLSTRMAMPMQQQIASGVKGQAKEEPDIEISQEPKQARVDDMVRGQTIERLYDEYGKENIQFAAAAYTALRSRVNYPLHFPFQLMSSTSMVAESAKRILGTSIRSIFQEQNAIIPSTILPSVVKDRFDVQKITINPYYARQMHGALESTTTRIGLSSFPEPAAKNASQPDRYLSHLYAKKEEEDITRYEFENRNLESKEQQLLVNPVTGLQREYSKYILHNAIYKPGKDQSILLTATRPSQPKSLLSTTTKTSTAMRERQADVRKSDSRSGYPDMAKIGNNSSINLPVVSQLQVMLANQYVDNSDHHINSLALLPQRQILSSPIPQAFAAQRLGTSFESTAGKQVSTISTNETNGKMLNERSSSTLTRESTESRFGQDSSSRSATKIEQEDTNKDFSLRQLRKMIEQIFHEELKRYGL